MASTNIESPPILYRRYKHRVRTQDSTTITIVPVIRHADKHEATSRYVDLYWTPIIGTDASGLLRWISYQHRPVSMTETQLATALGAHGRGQVRKAITSLIDCELATINDDVLRVSMTLPNLSVLQANRCGTAFANRHHHDAH